eukprot:TRINITY_DN5444_c0_g3_i2.p2 TRINITY_DN5444_c0_g3~~TRINITY_DN5444_c0_g3_i2.p2  ORF type:complete len:369 (+),score=130.68 TRINITY_DN5444_c0_g3_i2:192-1298(+)
MSSAAGEKSSRAAKERKLNGHENGGSHKPGTDKHGQKEDLTSKDYYFDSYSHFGIHEEMIKDEVRTQSYLDAIENNKELIKGKVVLDVGCGTGILSMFCARVGAKHVIAIECSGIAKQAQAIIAANGLSQQVTLLHAKCEDVAALPGGFDKVDIIVSEWMGYFLLYESMLDTVLYCRDRWLKPGGLLLPDRASLKIAAIEDEQYRAEKIDFWDSVYGFDMKVIKEIALTEPLVDVVDPKTVLSNESAILDLDLSTCTKADLAFSSEFSLAFTRDDTVHALVSHFDCAFSRLPSPVSFSTAPDAPYTHWKQTVFYLRDPVSVCAGDTATGRITVSPNAGNARDLDIALTLTFQRSGGGTLSVSQDFRLR